MHREEVHATKLIKGFARLRLCSLVLAFFLLSYVFVASSSLLGMRGRKALWYEGIIHGPQSDKILSRIWERKVQAHDKLRAAIEETLHDLGVTDIPPLNTYDPYEPEWNCEDEIRIGSGLYNIGDGPKFACGVSLLNATDNCVVYSIGSNWDFAFEYSVHQAAPHCEIHTFDGTMDLSSKPLPLDLDSRNIHFHNWNVVAGGNQMRDVQTVSYTFAETLKRLKHEDATITWLKIDCEGCEFSVIPEVLSHASPHQFLIEVHGLDALKVRNLFHSFSEAGLMIFHKERNHWGCKGYTCVEYSLISRPYAKRVLKNFLQSTHHTIDT